MKYKECCRTCLAREKEMRHLNSSISIAGNDVRLLEILQNFYEYKMNPDPTFPEYLCINCVHQLTITYSFKVLIDSTSKTLQNNANLIENNDEYDCSYNSDDEKLIKYKRRQKIPKVETYVEENLKTIFCTECKANFTSINSLKEHCMNNHPVKLEIGRDCDYCYRKFSDFRSLVLHRKLHLKPYLCENCWDGFYTEEELNLHSCQPNRNKDSTKAERVLRQCDQCGKSYPPGYIRIHMLTHGNDRPYSCKFCPKKFKVPGGLHSHVLWNHKRTRNHKCEVCNATFISSSSKSSHIRKNHLKEKKYRCDNCGKRFFSKSELQRHSLTHTGVKNFHCHVCTKSYQTRYGLNVHLKSSHSQMNMNVLSL